MLLINNNNNHQLRVIVKLLICITANVTGLVCHGQNVSKRKNLLLEIEMDAIIISE